MPLFARFFVLAVALRAVCLSAQPTFSKSTPFVSGQNGYNTYRIPALVGSTNGTLLAFCEGRKNSGSDSGDIDIVLRRSTNSGATWLAQAIVQEEGGSAAITIGNPAPVVDETTGYIHLLFCRNNSRVFHTVSTNDGATWSTRTEITASVKPTNWDWYATGPGHGIQLRRGAQVGRLVVSCDHVTTNGINGAHVIYSDDHGVTWQLGANNDSTGNINPNETLCVELVGVAPGGGSRMYFNSRDQNGSAAGTRAEAWSANGGSAFAGPFTNRTGFICPVVQGSLLRLRATDEGSSANRLLFACPNDPSARVQLSVWSSSTEAVSWGSPKPIYDGPSAYSDMARTSVGDVGLLYEKGDGSPYETVTFARFNEAWLDSGATAEENPQPAFWNFEEKLLGQSADTNTGALLDVHPFEGGNNLTAQKAFNYVLAGTNFGSGTALAFDGTGGLQISDTATANHFDFGGTNSFTIEAVFRIPSGSTQTGALVAKDYGTLLPSWWFRVENGKLRFLVSDGTVENAVTASKLVNDGQWHHAAAVRDARIPSTKVLRIFLDSVLQTNIVDNTTGSLANGMPLNVGRFGASSTRNLTGDVDMARITPRALAPAEFLGHYTQFDADADLIPDTFERDNFGSVTVVGAGDTDGDGFVDALEFALGTELSIPESKPRLDVHVAADAVVATTLQRALPPWLELGLETSSDLVNWQTVSGNVTLAPQGNGVFERRQAIPFSAGTPAKLFLRLNLKQLP